MNARRLYQAVRDFLPLVVVGVICYVVFAFNLHV